MPVGALSELVSRLSSATSHDVQISTHPFSPQAVVQPASLPDANAPPSARQDSTSHASSDATSEAVRPSRFEHNFGILRPSVSIRRHLHQPVPPPPLPLLLPLSLYVCIYIIPIYIYIILPTHTSQCSSGHSMRSILPPHARRTGIYVCFRLVIAAAACHAAASSAGAGGWHCGGKQGHCPRSAHKPRLGLNVAPPGCLLSQASKVSQASPCGPLNASFITPALIRD